MLRFGPRRGVILTATLAAILFAAAAFSAVFATRGSTHLAARAHGSKESARALFGNRGEPGENEALGEHPATPAEQDYQERASPADVIPFSATVNSVQSWKQISKGKNSAGQWTLAGPSSANY